MAFLEIENLNLSIGENQILHDIDLTLERGETIGIVGESGSGKSMTAFSILQLLPKGSNLSGSIRLDGRELIGANKNILREIRGKSAGIIFQEPMTALNPVKTIGAQIAEGIIHHLQVSRGEAEAQVARLLDQVGLNARHISADRFPHELSGGQRQRVVIAIALALNPALLIADEPTTALDVTTQARILDLLRELVAENGSSLMLISHDLAVVAEMVSKIAILQNGCTVESGETLNLFETMQKPYTKALLAAANVPPRAVKPTIVGAPLVEANSLIRQYNLPRKKLFGPAPKFTAVNNVSLKLAKGESLGLVGESGCGKSTLARMILALNQPSGGKVTFLSKSLFDLPRDELREMRRHMQVVFQDPYGSFNPRHKVMRLVGEPLHLMAELDEATRHKKVFEALEDVGLAADSADRYPHEFSGGQRQRIAIARAIITEPQLIVADEPVSALDVTIRAQVLELFNDLAKRKNLSYIFISHDLNVVRAVTDRVLIMKDGRIIEEGQTQKVFDAPAHNYTKSLLAAAPNLERTLARLALRRENS